MERVDRGVALNGGHDDTAFCHPFLPVLGTARLPLLRGVLGQDFFDVLHISLVATMGRGGLGKGELLRGEIEMVFCDARCINLRINPSLKRAMSREADDAADALCGLAAFPDAQPYVRFVDLDVNGRYFTLLVSASFGVGLDIIRILHDGCDDGAKQLLYFVHTANYSAIFDNVLATMWIP